MELITRLVLALVLVGSGLGADFSGSGDDIDQADAVFDLSTDYTFCVWLSEAAENRWRVPIDKHVSYTDRQLFFAITPASDASGQDRLIGDASSGGVGSAGYNIGATDVIADGTWRHGCITFSSSSSAIGYNNAVAQGTDSSVAALNTGGNLKIGDSAAVGSAEVDGELLDVRVYSRKLSAAEVQTLFSSEGRHSILPDVAWYPMMEGAPGVAMSAGATVRDYGINGVHATPGATKPSYAESPLRGHR